MCTTLRETVFHSIAGTPHDTGTIDSMTDAEPEYVSQGKCAEEHAQNDDIELSSTKCTENSTEIMPDDEEGHGTSENIGSDGHPLPQPMTSLNSSQQHSNNRGTQERDEEILMQLEKMEIDLQKEQEKNEIARRAAAEAEEQTKAEKVAREQAQLLQEQAERRAAAAK